MMPIKTKETHMHKRFGTFLLLLILSITTSCGDMFMTDEKDSGGMSGINAATCELDPEAFAEILERDISNDIKCLDKMLNTFVEFVRTDRPGYISKDTLKTFITSGSIEGVDEDITEVIDAIFDLSFLILGGDRGYISLEGKAKLVDMLLYFNQHIWKVYKKFVNEDTVNYTRHMDDRQVVYNEFVHISKKVRSIFSQNRGGEVHRIDSEKFLAEFFGATPETYNKITSLMFLKKMFIGGQKFDLTYLELEDALYKLPELAVVAYDFVKTKKFDFSDDLRAMMLVYNQDVKLAKDLLFYGNDDLEQIFTIYDLYSAFDNLIPDFMKDLALRKYPREIIEIKSALLESNNGKHFTSKEVDSLLALITDIFDEGEFFFRVYEHYQEELDSRGELTISFENFPVKDEVEKEYLANFSRIVNQYKYIKGTFKAPYFSFEYYRNPAGYMEIMALEKGVHLLFKKYGRANPNARGKYKYDMTLDQTVAFIHKIKRFLRDYGITTVGRKDGGEAVSTAENLVLMSTLFQNQSDGCDADTVCMEVPEITEFLVGLLTALSVKDFFIEEIKSICPNVDPDIPGVPDNHRISVQCFRENFIEVLKRPIKGDGRSLAEYMPLLYSYIMDLTKDVDPNAGLPTESEDYVKFLNETEAFTRTCTHYDDGESLPMKSTDAFAVFAGLLNVESTVLRFDTNQNNKMDGSKNHNEVLSAYYEVYEGAIKGLVAPDGGFMEKLAKPIFQYLVKYGEVPDTKNFTSIWAFVKFLLKVNKRADATRTTVATILKTLGEQSENTKLHPFKCTECLGTPGTQCIPDDGDWDYDWSTEEFK
jgi:hypothetical protein